MLNPEDLKKKTFTKGFRGYEVEEVDKFLAKLIKEYEYLYLDNLEQKETIERVSSKLEYYQQMEATMQSTLAVAQETADEVKNASEKKAALLEKETAVKCEQQLSEARNTPIVAAAKKVGPAVVGITNKAYVRDFFNRTQLMERGTGSGVIYDKAGYIATNNHVVEGASEIIVSLPDGRTVKGKVLGADAVTDLAVVKIDADNLTVATFGDSDTLQVGEPAIAIGNPLGLEFRGSVTAGVISALNRSIEVGERKFNLIQTDAAINPGNSGGALVNADGEVVGINSAKVAVSGVEGIGFAIPINTAKPILQELAERRRDLFNIEGTDL